MQIRSSLVRVIRGSPTHLKEDMLQGFGIEDVQGAVLGGHQRQDSICPSLTYFEE